MTQEQAAEHIGCATKQLGRVENGQMNVTLGLLVAIAVAYRVPLVALFDHTA
jgi:transcriptional regulator with XRE-family HTH domain